MEMEPRLSLIRQTGEAGNQTLTTGLQGEQIIHYTVWSDRLEKPGIKPGTTGLQDE